MPKINPPELKKYMDKNVTVKLNGSRSVKGVLRGFDTFMNCVISLSDTGKMAVVRGNSIIQMECHDWVK